MTREEIKKAMNDTKKEVVLKNLHKLLSLVEGYPEYEDCVGYAIEKLEQEPILDKIRAEIDKIYEREGNSVDCLNALNELKWFIDKYKGESEE